jgi:hypothetical protein
MAAEPHLFVADIEAACRFDVQRLGFAVAFSYGEPPFHAQEYRDRIHISGDPLSPPPLGIGGNMYHVPILYGPGSAIRNQALLLASAASRDMSPELV